MKKYIKQINMIDNINKKCLKEFSLRHLKYLRSKYYCFKTLYIEISVLLAKEMVYMPEGMSERSNSMLWMSPLLSTSCDWTTRPMKSVISTFTFFFFVVSNCTF